MARRLFLGWPPIGDVQNVENRMLKAKMLNVRNVDGQMLNLNLKVECKELNVKCQK
jgi:hypothetical protein